MLNEPKQNANKVPILGRDQLIIGGQGANGQRDYFDKMWIFSQYDCVYIVFLKSDVFFGVNQSDFFLRETYPPIIN